MDIKTALEENRSKEQILRIRDYIGTDTTRFDELMQLIFHSESPIPQRASWTMMHCADAHPELLTPYLGRLFQHLRQEGLHDSIKRNSLRALQKVDLPEQVMGEAADICFAYLANPNEAVAIRVFSMNVLWNICKKEPDLSNELKLLIEEFMPYGSTGFKNRGNKILKAIERNS